jgi:hypothetical protein
MANSIVFQSSAEQLKSAVYGYDGSNYQPLKVNASGELNMNVSDLQQVGSIKGGTTTIDSIVGGTINVAAIAGGTITTVSTVTSVIDVEELGSLKGGTITDVLEIGSLKSGTTTVDSIVGGTINVAAIAGGTITDVLEVGSIKGGTINAKIADRTFTATTEYVQLAAASGSTGSSAWIDISKYQDTSWYLRNVSATKGTVTAQLGVSPERATYPIVLVQETASVKSTKVITNDYFMRDIKVYLVTSANVGAATQTVQITFNGRY